MRTVCINSKPCFKNSADSDQLVLDEVTWFMSTPFHPIDKSILIKKLHHGLTENKKSTHKVHKMCL